MEALEFYKMINLSVGGDQDAANAFVNLVFEILLKAAQKELLAYFDDSITSIDSFFTKEDNIK